MNNDGEYEMNVQTMKNDGKDDQGWYHVSHEKMNVNKTMFMSLWIDK